MSTPRFVDNLGFQTKLLITGVDFVVFGHPVNFNYFVNTPAVEASAAARQYQTSDRKEHKRRAYKGATTLSTIPKTSYSYIDDPGRKIGNAMPGWSFVLTDGIEKRQFTTTADVLQLIAYLEDDAKMDLRLYTQGARYTIKAATAEGGGE